MKIGSEELEPVASYLLERGGVVSATQISKLMGVGFDTLWRNLRERGMQPTQARELARTLDSEANKLRTAARYLRDAAGEG